MKTEKNKTANIPESQESLKKGKEAIDMHNEVYKKGKSKEEKDKSEEKDAEKWHSEG